MSNVGTESALGLSYAYRRCASNFWNISLVTYQFHIKLTVLKAILGVLNRLNTLMLPSFLLACKQKIILQM